jgi:hypothetical protein
MEPFNKFKKVNENSKEKANREKYDIRNKCNIQLNINININIKK